MKHIIFSVYDNVAKAFIPPFFLPNEDMAKRAFSDAVNDEKHQFSQHPEDYSLYAVGSFDDTNGMITEYAENTKLGNGIEFITIIAEPEKEKLFGVK